jgi:hypothetical protein
MRWHERLFNMPANDELINPDDTLARMSQWTIEDRQTTDHR